VACSSEVFAPKEIVVDIFVFPTWEADWGVYSIDLVEEAVDEADTDLTGSSVPPYLVSG
jgi:hypothetical protein